MKIERIKDGDGRVRFDSLDAGTAFLCPDPCKDIPFIKIKSFTGTPGKTVDNNDYNSIWAENGILCHFRPDALVTPLLHAVIRY